MWDQAYKYPANPNITSIWIAQFDEVDEGTAIFKVIAKAEDLPLPQNGWLALDDVRELPSDWYLRLAGEAQRMLGGERALTPNITLNPGAPWVTYTSGPTGRPSAARTPSTPTSKAGKKGTETSRPSPSTPTSRPSQSKLQPDSKAEKKETKGRKDPPT